MKVIFLCVANSARSQMAEGLARALAREDVEVLSAGSQPTQVNPFALQAMAEIGIDISLHRSKSTAELNMADADFVITLCADEVCPLFIGNAERLHWPFPDPAAKTGDPDQILASFREIRDQLQSRIRLFLIEKNQLK